MAKPAFHKVLLLGAGHGHLDLLKHLGELTGAGVEVTVVSPEPVALYSGMIPGFLGGRYDREAVSLPVREIVEQAGAIFVEDMVTGIQASTRRVALASGRELSYEVLSVAMGSVVATGLLPEVEGGPADGVFPVKPFANLEAARDRVREILDSRDARAVVVGGGPAAVEIAGNLARLGREAARAAGSSGTRGTAADSAGTPASPRTLRRHPGTDPRGPRREHRHPRHARGGTRVRRGSPCAVLRRLSPPRPRGSATRRRAHVPGTAGAARVAGEGGPRRRLRGRGRCNHPRSRRDAATRTRRLGSSHRRGRGAGYRRGDARHNRLAGICRRRFEPPRGTTSGPHRRPCPARRKGSPPEPHRARPAGRNQEARALRPTAKRLPRAQHGKRPGGGVLSRGEPLRAMGVRPERTYRHHICAKHETQRRKRRHRRKTTAISCPTTTWAVLSAEIKGGREQ